MASNFERELDEFLTCDLKASEISKKTDTKSNWRIDIKNIALLIFLYILQGIPLGLSGSIPFLLGARKVTYSDQGTFSFAFWPFSIKLLWAPIVDSIYCNKIGGYKIGRRKSWLIPVQLLIGVLMFSTANVSERLINSGQTKGEIISLTTIFIAFNTLAATQDIAVDGWALTMLHKENVGWQSTCNGVGQTAGFFLGNYIFIVFESAKFCNDYIRPVLGLTKQEFGIISLRSFMYTAGVFYFLSTILVMIFKKEKDSDEKKLSMISTYKTIWKILCIPQIRKLVLILLTVKIGFAIETLSFLKFIEHGVSKEKLSLLAIPLTPVFIIWPFIISKYTSGPRAFIIYSKIYPFRLLSCLCIFVFVYHTPYFKNPITNEFDFKFYFICFILSLFNSIIESSMFVSQMAFFASISDETIGGTYMTFLATLSNLGGTYTSTGILFITNFLTFKYCEFNSAINNSTYLQGNYSLIANNKCSTTAETKECYQLGGKCIASFDAYNYLAVIFPVIGLIWIICFRRLIIKLNNTPKMAWKLT